MTILDEAIKHAEEKAEELNANAEYYKNHNMPEYLPSCVECAREHEQLAEWLRQLKAIKLLHKAFANSGGAFHYEVGRALEGDYVLDKPKSEGAVNG